MKMSSTGIELFMENLKHMIHSNDNPLTNHPSILSERGQFQLLYEELHSVIQTLHSIDDQHHELQQVKDLKRRFKDAAEFAHDAIDLFVYHINRGNQMLLNLDDVMRLIKYLKEKLMNIINNDMIKMDSSPSTYYEEKQTAATGIVTGTKKASEDIIVGFDRHAELIGLNLIEGPRQLDVVSIVGMGGLGKTTLAIKVFNDPFIMHHFHVRGWVTVTQTYEKKDLFIQILESIGNTRDSLINRDYPQLRQMLHQRLMNNKYLIVIDDIWSPEAWDALKMSFPNDNNRSRILLTSSLKEVALHANPYGHAYIHQLRYLTEEESWGLLCRKVFGGSNACPEWFVKSGMKIAKKLSWLTSYDCCCGRSANERNIKKRFMGKNWSKSQQQQQQHYRNPICMGYGEGVV